MQAKIPTVLMATMTELGGIATRKALRVRGISGYSLTSAVRSGIVVRVRRAWYALPGLDDHRRIAIMLGGRIGGMSAAASYGWWIGLEERVHVSWPAHGNVAKPGRVQFAYPDSRSARDHQIVQHWRVLHGVPSGRSDEWRESPLESLAQVMLCSDRTTAVACADSAMRVGTVSESAVRALIASLPERFSAWNRYLDPRSDSGLESIVRCWLIERGIPFEFHRRIDGVGEVDFVVGRSIIIETDGRQFHDAIADATRDANRDNALSIRGYIVIRLRYAMVMYNWPACELRILEHLSRQDHLRRVV